MKRNREIDASRTGKSMKLSRREVLGGAVAAATVVPRHVLGGSLFTAPSEKPNLAGVGIGGVGHGLQGL